MNSKELSSEIDALLRGLRSCDTQATAIQWMTRAYKAMELSLDHFREPEAQDIVFVPTRPKLEIVQSIPRIDLRYAQARRLELQRISHNKTVVYPEFLVPPGSRLSPKAWTREDTVRLERAAKLSRPPVQRRGR